MLQHYEGAGGRNKLFWGRWRGGGGRRGEKAGRPKIQLARRQMDGAWVAPESGEEQRRQAAAVIIARAEIISFELMTLKVAAYHSESGDNRLQVNRGAWFARAWFAKGVGSKCASFPRCLSCFTSAGEAGKGASCLLQRPADTGKWPRRYGVTRNRGTARRLLAWYLATAGCFPCLSAMRCLSPPFSEIFKVLRRAALGDKFKLSTTQGKSAAFTHLIV